EPSIDYVVTKIPRFAFEVLAHGHHSASRPHAHHADEKRRRSDGHRPHVQGKPAKMPALVGTQWPGALESQRKQICVKRPPSPRPSPQGEGVSFVCFLIARQPSDQSPTHDIPRNWRTILLLPGEKAGMRAGVKPLSPRSARRW